VAMAWFTVIGLLASWWLEHSDRIRTA